MLAEENQIPNNNTSPNIIHQMQLFDLDRPKDITTFIEVVQEDYVEKEKTLNVLNKKKSNTSKKKRAPNKNTKRQINVTTPNEGISKSSLHQCDELCSQYKNRHMAPNDVIGNTSQNLRPLQNENCGNVPNTSIYNNTQRNIPLSVNQYLFSEQASWQRNAQTTNSLESMRQIGQNISLEFTNRRNHPVPIGATPNAFNSVQNVNQFSHMSRVQYSLNVVVCEMIHVLAKRKSAENGSFYPQGENEHSNFENKMKMFQNCYKHVVIYLLPQENNITFFNNFISKIVNIAKSRSIIIQYCDVHRLLFEMLQWCKQRKMFETTVMAVPQYPPPYNPPPYNPPKYSTPPRTQASEHHSQDDSSHSTSHESNKVGQTTCLFSLGSPGREISINMDSNLYNTFLNKPQDPGNNIISKQLHENQNIHDRETPKLCEMAVNPTADSSQKPASDGFIEIEIPMINERIQSHNENVNHANISCYKHSSIPNNVSHSILNENEEPYNKHQNVVKEKLNPIVNYNSLPNYTSHKNMASYNNSVSVIVNNNNIHQRVQHTNNGLQNQGEVSRSSVSRDSGFMSPLNFNNLDDQTSPLVPNEEVSPIITHVTSLSNNAEYIAKGHCNVCKRETNKQCIGCYKIYYCSRECQQAEWHLHKFFCF